MLYEVITNSVLSNLGFLPNLAYSAVEAIHLPVQADTKDWAIVTGSDAHSLEQVGRRACYIEMEDLSYENLKEALQNKNNVSYQQ